LGTGSRQGSHRGREGEGEVNTMARETFTQAATLAKAAVIFCQNIYQAFPGSSIEPLDHHYSDEDLTLEVRVPTGVDVRHVSDELIRMALDMEDQYGVTIVARAVRK
jgi:hypothetical protein